MGVSGAFDVSGQTIHQASGSFDASFWGPDANDIAGTMTVTGTDISSTSPSRRRRSRAESLLPAAFTLQLEQAGVESGFGGDGMTGDQACVAILRRARDRVLKIICETIHFGLGDGTRSPATQWRIGDNRGSVTREFHMFELRRTPFFEKRLLASRTTEPERRSRSGWSGSKPGCLAMQNRLATA